MNDPTSRAISRVLNLLPKGCIMGVFVSDEDHAVVACALDGEVSVAAGESRASVTEAIVALGNDLEAVLREMGNEPMQLVPQESRGRGPADLQRELEDRCREVGVLRATLRHLLDLADGFPESEMVDGYSEAKVILDDVFGGCTGRPARWCPTCGECTCPRPTEEEPSPATEPQCPLHAPDSPHAEGS